MKQIIQSFNLKASDLPHGISLEEIVNPETLVIQASFQVGNHDSLTLTCLAYEFDTVEEKERYLSIIKPKGGDNPKGGKTYGFAPLNF